MMKFRLRVTPALGDSHERCDAFRTWMQASGQASTRQRDEAGVAYLVDLDTLYPALLALREYGIAATEYRVELERSSGRQRKMTTHALNRRVAAIEMALLTVNDLHSLGHFAEEGDLRVIIDALLLLLLTTQQGLESVPSAACTDTTGGKQQ